MGEIRRVLLKAQIVECEIIPELLFSCSVQIMRFAVSLFVNWLSLSNDEMSRLVYSVHERFCSWRGTLQNCSGNSPSIPATQKSFMGIGVHCTHACRCSDLFNFSLVVQSPGKGNVKLIHLEGRALYIILFAAFEDLVLSENNRLFHF